MAHGTGSDFTGKMEGNCMFNNSPAGLEGGRLAGLRSRPEIPASVPGNPLAPEPARETWGPSISCWPRDGRSRQSLDQGERLKHSHPRNPLN